MLWENQNQQITTALELNIMQLAKHIVHSNQLYPHSNGLIQVRYVGQKYPESQWAGLVDKAPSHVTTITEIGRITLEAEGIRQLFDVDRHLLTIAKRYGAHIVLINSLKAFESDGDDLNKYTLRIYGRCQRFEL